MWVPSELTGPSDSSHLSTVVNYVHNTMGKDWLWRELPVS